MRRVSKLDINLDLLYNVYALDLVQLKTCAKKAIFRINPKKLFYNS